VLGLWGHANHCLGVWGLAYRVFAPQEGALAPSWLKASRILKEDLMMEGTWHEGVADEPLRGCLNSKP